ncbi:hypothetical protein NDU88_002515 [Pleurodeles waltl]|uniref:Uncharacterized protein n=1 Tax=Pleurodeles waltl TaxID=8319 RepID=A0AAV7UVU0_PLEWA|nr:hypothetical protein NDU88_002515 [Pleurodeles waltl]
MEEDNGSDKGSEQNNYMWMEDNVDGSGTGNVEVQDGKEHNVDGMDNGNDTSGNYIGRGVELEEDVSNERMGQEELVENIEWMTWYGSATEYCSREPRVREEKSVGYRSDLFPVCTVIFNKED